MVLMRNSYRRCLMTLGLGAAIAGIPTALVAASEVSTPSEANSQLKIEIAQDDSLQLEPSPADQEPAVPADAASPAVEPGLTLEPGEEAVPLEVDGAELPSSAGLAGGAVPQSDRPTDEGFETPPDYLFPDPNPLALPTQPDEVDIIGIQPISLETAVELAYRNNEQLRIAVLQLERSRSGLRAEQALRYPTVDLTGGLQTTNSPTFNTFSSDDTTTSLTGQARTDYDLGLSGERSARIRAAEEQVRLAELQVEQTREQLRLDTTTDYYAVQQAIEQIRINQTFLTEAERNLQDTQLREEVGVGTRFDVLRADVQVANARQTLTQAISQRDIAQRQLARRLNVPPSIDITTLEVKIAGTWPLSLEESIVLAYQNRAELEQFLVEQNFNEAQRQASLAAVRPNLGVFAEYQLQSLLNSPEGVDNSTDDGFSIGAQLTWRLFDGGAASARAAQSDRDIDIDQSEFESARNDIRVQVEEAYYTLVSNQANISTATVAVNQAAEALELANLRFNAGVGTQLDVLNATSELTQAQGNLVSAVLDYNRALSRLERAVSNLAPPEVPVAP
ncbi:MAG: TolC family protein [Nodosilinea sp.]